MKFKKVAALLLAGVMCAASVVGCGKTDEGNETKAPSSTSSGGDATSASGDVEKVSLTVWAPTEDQNPDMGNWLETRCKAFNEAHPEWDITFTYAVCSEADAGSNVSKDPTVAADVFMYANDQLATLIDCGGIARLGGETEEYIRSTNSELIVNTVTSGEGVYGVPFTGNTWFMYYDKRVFTEEDVKSMETMLEKGKVSFTLGNGWYNASIFAGMGCTWFGDGTDESKGIDFTGDKATKAVEYMFDLNSNPKFVFDGGNKGVSFLKDGTANAMFSGTWDYNNLAEAIGEENVGVAIAPTIKIDGKDVQMKPFYGSKAIGVNQNTKNMKVAVQLALWLANEDSQRLHYELRKVVPCNTNLLADETISQDPLCKVQGNIDVVVPQPAVAAISKFWTPAESLGKKIYAGMVNREDAASLAAELNEAINKNAI